MSLTAIADCMPQLPPRQENFIEPEAGPMKREIVADANDPHRRYVYELPETEPLTMDRPGGGWKYNPLARMVSQQVACVYCEERGTESPWFEWNARGMAGTTAGRYVCPACYADYLRKRRAGEISDAPKPLIEVTIPPAYDHAELARVVILRGKSEVCGEKVLMRWPDKMPLLRIQGCPGSGKTYATFALVKHLLRQGRRVVYRDCGELRDHWLKATMFHGGAQRIEDELLNTPFLILDGLDQPQITEGWTALVLRVLNIRVQYERATVVTMATSGQQIENAYGPQVRSRLRRFVGVEMPVKDRNHAGA